MQYIHKIYGPAEQEIGPPRLLTKRVYYKITQFRSRRCHDVRSRSALQFIIIMTIKIKWLYNFSVQHTETNTKNATKDRICHMPATRNDASNAPRTRSGALIMCNYQRKTMSLPPYDCRMKCDLRARASAWSASAAAHIKEYRIHRSERSICLVGSKIAVLSRKQAWRNSFIASPLVKSLVCWDTCWVLKKTSLVTFRWLLRFL